MPTQHTWGEIAQSTVTIVDGSRTGVVFPDQANRNVVEFSKTCMNCGEEAKAYETTQNWFMQYRTCDKRLAVFPKQP